MELSNVQKDILEYCSSDVMGFWVVVRYITEDKFDHILIPPRSEQKKVLLEIKELLLAGLIDVWQYDGTKFEQIEGSVSQLLAFIDNTWRKLGTMPSGGDVCWFKATSKGEAFAKGLNLLE